MATLEDIDRDILAYIRWKANADDCTAMAILRALSRLFGRKDVVQERVDDLVISAAEGNMAPLDLVLGALHAFC